MNAFSDFMGFVIPVIVSVPFLIVALVFVFLALRNRGHVKRALRHWQGVHGRILASEVERRRSSSGDGGTSISYYPVVIYEYEVGGRRYQGRRLSFGTEVGWGGFTNQAQKKVAQYPPGSVVPVYFNPENPSEAVLEVSSPAGCIYWGIAALIIVIVAVTLVFSLGIANFTNSVTQFASGMAENASNVAK